MNAPLRYPLVAVKERPFDGRVRIIDVDWSDKPSIADILAEQTDLPPRFRDGCSARINGVPVPRAMWRHVRPKMVTRDVVVDFFMPMCSPGGSGSSGGGGRKNATAEVATIAVLLAATIVSAGTLGLPAVGFLSAAAVNSVAGAAIGKAGRLETNALGASS